MKLSVHFFRWITFRGVGVTVDNFSKHLRVSIQQGYIIFDSGAVPVHELSLYPAITHLNAQLSLYKGYISGKLRVKGWLNG